jgi:hypothetical protein
MVASVFYAQDCFTLDDPEGVFSGLAVKEKGQCDGSTEPRGRQLADFEA